MTPTLRVLKAAQVAYSLHSYEHDLNADSFGLEAAEKLGVPPEQVFKTLVAQIDGKQLVLAVVPVTARLDLKKLATAIGGKKAELADSGKAERATGYVGGGISPLGGRKKLRTLVDRSVLVHETVFVSAGQRGVQVELSPGDLLRLTEATAADLTTE